MNKSSTIHTRIQPSLKEEAEAILNQLGLSTSEAIAIFFRQITLHGGLPFDVKIPNKLTQKAMAETRAGKNTKRFDDVKDLMRDLEC